MLLEEQEILHQLVLLKEILEEVEHLCQHKDHQHHTPDNQIHLQDHQNPANKKPCWLLMCMILMVPEVILVVLTPGGGSGGYSWRPETVLGTDSARNDP